MFRKIQGSTDDLFCAISRDNSAILAHLRTPLCNYFELSPNVLRYSLLRSRPAEGLRVTLKKFSLTRNVTSDLHLCSLNSALCFTALSTLSLSLQSNMHHARPKSFKISQFFTEKRPKNRECGHRDAKIELNREPDSKPKNYRKKPRT
jgi:hypothetical protein